MSEQPMITFASHEARAGHAGASEDFEQMLGLLVRATSGLGDASLVFANPGDWGIDVLAGDLNGRVTVWQAKYFVRGVGRGQQRQITGSFASALEAAAGHGYALERWVLCIPASMDGPTTQWWQGWKAERERDTGVVIELWDESRLRELLLRPEAADVRRHFYNPYRRDGQGATLERAAFPYQGLSAFAEKDAGLFFGREVAAGRVVDLMSASLAGVGVVVVSGVSGAGKSSLLRAGVLSRLRETGLTAAPEASSWPCVVFTPGHRPLEELAVQIAPLAHADAAGVRERLAADPAGFALTARQAALAAPGARAGASLPGLPQRRVLLVVDQCEQLFTLCQSQQERRAFITALHAAAAGEMPSALVVLVVRADFEARLADYPQLGEAVQGRYLLAAMTGRQLRLAITQPAVLAGSRVDGDLVQVLLEEIRSSAVGSLSPGPADAGVLPLLSHALDQAWRTRAGHVLTLADYERTGGIEGAVAETAQRAYALLPPGQQEVARQVFTRLVATSGDGMDTTAPATRADLTTGHDIGRARDVDAVLETFAAQRLLTLDAGKVEITHEALLTAWPQLREWLAATHADRAVRTTLHSTAAEWERAGRDPAYLYSGTRLEAAGGAAARISADARHTPLSPAEKNFLRASGNASRRNSRRRRTVTAVLLASVTALTAVAVTALHASQAAARERDAAISGQLAASSLATAGTNITAAAVEGIAAWGLDHSSAQARYAMLNAAASPQIATFTGGHGAVNWVAFSPDGKLLATAGDDGTARLWDLASNQQVGHAIADGSRQVISVAFSPDGKLLATGGANGTARLWDVASGHQVGHGFHMRSPRIKALPDSSFVVAAFSPDGKALAVSSIDPSNPYQLWDIATGRQITHDTGIRSPSFSTSAAFSPLVFSSDGKLLATDRSCAIHCTPGTVQLRNVATGAELHFINADGSQAASIAFSPGGKLLATADPSGWVRLWDVTTGRPSGGRLGSHSQGIDAVAFSPDGKLLATGDSAGTAQLWNLTTRQQLGGTLRVGVGKVTSVAFSPDGHTLATGDDGGAARLWNVQAAEQSGRPATRGAHPAVALAVSPDGRTLATDDGNGSVRLWDMATTRQVGPTLSASNGSVVLWEMATTRQAGAAFSAGTSFENETATLAFSPDGKVLATGDANGNVVKLWNPATGRQIGPALRAGQPQQGVTSVAFSPDGKTLATAVTEGQVLLWEVATGRRIGRPISRSSGSSGPGSSVAFSPDGKILSTINGDDAVQLWNVSSGDEIGGPLNGGQTGAGSIAFSPDGTTLAASYEDGSVRLWDVATGRQAANSLADGPGYPPASVAFSPDGKTLVTSSLNGGTLLWDVATGQQIGSPLNADHPDGPAGPAVFTPDGTKLVIGAGIDLATLWNVSYLAGTLGHLCAQVGGSITPAEWTQYVPPGPPYQKVCP